ncbi:MAG: helix-hairpin-helix domain-containing protein [Syntrophobacteraceae bacterium]
MRVVTPGRKIQAAVVLVAVLVFCLLLWRSYRGPQSPAAVLPAPVAVEVKGDVPAPGIYLLDGARARVSDALSAAGWSGLLPEVSRKLESGESLGVLKTGSYPQITAGRMPAPARLAFGLKLDLNSASAPDLMLVPRMRPDTAASIVKRREQKRWENIEELVEIHGVGAKTVQKFEQFLEAGPRGDVREDPR